MVLRLPDCEWVLCSRKRDQDCGRDCPSEFDDGGFDFERYGNGFEYWDINRSLQYSGTEFLSRQYMSCEP